METIARHLIIQGRVQGVFYRASCAEAAQKIGVVGWVRNLPDGTVEAWIQGAPERVKSLIDWCWQGPTFARVDDIRIENETPDGGYEGFVKRY